MAVPFQKLQEGLDSIGNFFSDLINYINPFSEDFILKRVLDFFEELLSYINPFSENFFVYKLLELLGNLLKTLFVPEKSPLENFKQKVQDKLYFVTQISEMFSTLLGNVDYGTTTPSFSITYYGQTVNIIDFSLFVNYRMWLHGIILAIAWFMYIRKLFNKLPNIIGGV